MPITAFNGVLNSCVGFYLADAQYCSLSIYVLTWETRPMSVMNLLLPGMVLINSDASFYKRTEGEGNRRGGC